jgi:uncharacterized repeat protein (TIGR03943 family)
MKAEIYPKLKNSALAANAKTLVLILRPLTFILLGAWLLWRLWDGTLSYYLHPRYNLLIAVSGLALTFLGGWLIWQRLEQTGKAPEKAGKLEAGLITGLILVGVIALLGLLVTPHPLESQLTPAQSNGGNRALADALQKQNWQEASAADTIRWNLLDWSAALNNPDRAAQLKGRPADVVGFVIRPSSGSSQYFWVARYVVVCCTADSTALRVPVFSQGSDLQEGQWVRVKGSLGNANGNFGFIASNIQSVARPAQPYIYP